MDKTDVMKEIVARGVAAHAEIDTALADARAAALTMPTNEAACLAALKRARQASAMLEIVHDDGVAAGMVTKALAAKLLLHRSRRVTALINNAVPLAGMLDDIDVYDVLGAIAEAGLASAELHAEDTAIAKANGVDTGQLASVAGIILPLSGGR